jgi:hypothetical protein
MFLVTQLLGGVILYFTYRGVFDLLTAFITVILMIGLQFHVLVRKPDGTSIRMACFTTALWMAALFAARLFLEFRGWSVSIAAMFVFIVTAGAAAVSSYALLRRPLDMDVEE